MNEWTPTPEFEESVRQSFQVPATRQEFKNCLYQELMHRAGKKTSRNLRVWRLKPAWVVALGLLMIMIVSTLVIGPQRVYASVLRLLGYIPGVGIVNSQNSIRILAEPVSVTRDGITVSINQAVLTDTETKILYGVSGVPLSAYPQGEAVSGCIQREYLHLPDGGRIEIDAPVPSDIQEATFILPCIFNTLPGSAPEQWEIPLRFIPAPPDFQILPVVEITSAPITPQAVDGDTSSAAIASVTVEDMIETEDGYILLGYVRPNLPEGSWLQITGAAVIRDADKKKVSYTFPMDVQPLDDSSLMQGGGAWAIQFKGAGIRFPITISFTGVALTPLDPQATAKTTIDVGHNPQPGQVWELNREIRLAGRSIRLVSLTAQSDGYSFHIDLGSDLNQVSVAIEGYQAIGGGGGGQFTSLSFDGLPKGNLVIVFSNPEVASPAETWQVSWQPDQMREFATNANSPVCFNADSIQDIATLPAGLDGTVVLTQMNPQRQIVSSRMNGTQQRVLGINAARAALNADGTLLAYVNDAGIVIRNLNSGETSTIAGSFGRDIHWSPDSRFLAGVNSGNAYGIFMVNLESKAITHLSNLGYEAIAGWSPDGSTLYYAIPGSSDNGFLLRAVNVITGETRDVFTLENSSRKAPLPALSPDGKRIAYRASDNSSLYIKEMDGGPAWLVVDNPAQAISGIAWEREGHLLGISLMTPEAPDGEVFLIDPDSCESYRLPGVTGAVDGINIP